MLPWRAHLGLPAAEQEADAAAGDEVGEQVQLQQADAALHERIVERFKGQNHGRDGVQQRANGAQQRHASHGALGWQGHRGLSVETGSASSKRCALDLERRSDRGPVGRGQARIAGCLSAAQSCTLPCCWSFV